MTRSKIFVASTKTDDVTGSWNTCAAHSKRNWIGVLWAATKHSEHSFARPAQNFVRRHWKSSPEKGYVNCRRMSNDRSANDARDSGASRQRLSQTSWAQSCAHVLRLTVIQPSRIAGGWFSITCVMLATSKQLLTERRHFTSLLG